MLLVLLDGSFVFENTRTKLCDNFRGKIFRCKRIFKSSHKENNRHPNNIMLKRKAHVLKESANQVLDDVSPITKKARHESPPTPSSVTSTEETERMIHLAAEFEKRTPQKPSLLTNQIFSRDATRRLFATPQAVQKQQQLPQTPVQQQQQQPVQQLPPVFVAPQATPVKVVRPVPMKSSIHATPAVRSVSQPITTPVPEKKKTTVKLSIIPPTSSSSNSTHEENKKVKQTMLKPFSLSSGRVRPYALKSSEELELERIQNTPKFKARKFNKGRLQSGVAGIKKVQKKPVTTFAEFSLGTARIAATPAKSKVSKAAPSTQVIPTPEPITTIPEQQIQPVVQQQSEVLKQQSQLDTAPKQPMSKQVKVAVPSKKTITVPVTQSSKYGPEPRPKDQQKDAVEKENVVSVANIPVSATAAKQSDPPKKVAAVKSVKTKPVTRLTIPRSPKFATTKRFGKSH
jgi:hypothetical protein